MHVCVGSGEKDFDRSVVVFLVFHCSLGSKDFCQLYYEVDIVEAILMFYVILLTLV